MDAMIKWSDVEARCRALAISNAEFCRRCGLSESAMNKGLRRNSKLNPAVRKLASEVLAEAQAGQAA